MSKSVKYAPYFFILPFFAVFFAFNLFPLLYTLVISFTNFSGFGPMEFVGFENYIRFITSDPLFWRTLWNTFIIVIIALPLQVIFALIMAVLLKDFFKGRTRGALQFLNFSPFLTTAMAVAILFAILFDTRMGTINGILGVLGVSQNEIPWLTSPTQALAVLTILLVWRFFGYLMVLIMAGLSTISETEYEAAKIDGASWLQSFCYITIPGLKSTFAFIITTSVIAGMQLFGEPFMLFEHVNQPFGGPQRVALTSIMYLYDTAFRRFNLGYGAALTYGIFIIIFILSIVPIVKTFGGEKE